MLLRDEGWRAAPSRPLVIAVEFVSLLAGVAATLLSSSE